MIRVYYMKNLTFNKRKRNDFLKLLTDSLIHSVYMCVYKHTTALGWMLEDNSEGMSFLLSPRYWVPGIELSSSGITHQLSHLPSSE